MDMSISASTSVSMGSDWVEGAGWLVGSDIVRVGREEGVVLMKRSEVVEVNV